MQAASPSPEVPPLVTVVYPCLNEGPAISGCVAAARAALDAAGLAGEVLVVDNASTDDSGSLAAAAGARVVVEPRRGYGSAILRGLREARGDYVVVLDADGTYPIEQVGRFVACMRDSGADFVIGNRFAGEMDHGAMPWMNRYVGNPVLSGLTRALFRVPVTDIHCGMRALRRSRVAELGLVAPGMEFATEMVVKALDRDLRVAEVGIPYRTRIGASKLNPFRDAWRHVEHMLAFSPSVLLLWPGLALFAFGFAVQLALLSGPRAILFRTWDVHANLAGLASATVGATLLSLGFVSAAHARHVGMRFRKSPVAGFVAARGDALPRAAGVVLTAAGTLTWGYVVASWVASGFGALAAVPILAFATALVATGVTFLATAFIVHVIRLGA
ncbi:MAG: glycosyltransferase family 2 protein [Myxococcota bacterium]